MIIDLTYYLPYVAWYSFLINAGPKDVRVYMNRTNALMAVDSQIWKGKLYVNFFSDTDGDLLQSGLDNKNPVYEDEISYENFKEMPSSTRENFRILDLQEGTYSWWAKMDETQSGFHSTFIPMKWEMENLVMLDMHGCVQNAVDVDKLDKMRSIIIDIKLASKTSYTTRLELTEEETVTLLTEIASKKEISLKDMDIYLWNRHELFSRTMMQYIGMDGNSTDMEFGKFFDEVDFEHHNEKKTPDVIYKVGDVYKVVEFTISDYNDTNALNRKVRKYNSIVSHIRAKAGIEIEYSVVMLCMDRTIRVWGDTSINAMIPTEQPDKLKAIMDMVESIPNYQAIRTAFNEIGDLSNMNDKDLLFRKLDELMDIKFENAPEFKAFTLSESMDTEVMNNHDYFLDNKPSDPCPDVEELWEGIEDLEDFELVKEINLNQKRNKFTHEIEEMRALKPEDVVKEMDDKVKELIEIGVDKIPKAFKIPALSKSTRPGYIPSSMGTIRSTDDGSVLMRPEFSFYEKMGKSEPLGLPLDKIMEFEEDVEDLFLLKPSNYEDMVEMVKATEFYSIMEQTEVMVREINLLAQRRYIGTKKNNQMVYKDYENFSLLIANSPQLNDRNQIHFRVMISENYNSKYNRLFKSFYPASFFGIDTVEDDLYMTKWLSLQMADLEHYETITKRLRVIISDMWEKTRETSPSAKRVLNSDRIPKIFQAVPILMMEHKRNTSTINQLSRYLMHSGTSILSNYSKLAKEMFKTPRRSIVQCWVVMKQVNWFKGMLMNQDVITEFVKNMLSGDEDRDRLKLKSLFSGEMVDFQLIMEEIYYSNLFNYRHGFKGHRDKAIVEKVLTIEEEYLERVKTGSVIGEWKDVYYDKDELCKINLSFIKRMTLFYLAKEENQEMVKIASSRSLEFGLSKILKMTRSVVGTPDDFEPFVNYSGSVDKATVFEAIVDQLENLSEVRLLEIVKNEEDLLAIFSTFSKDQIGDVREILIQTIMTRICTAMMNNFFEILCEKHEKDMTTKESIKREKQSRTLLQYADECERINRTYKKAAMMFSINSDASKWAQSMLMPGYSIMVKSMESFLNDKLSKYFLAMFSAYANKIMYIPASLLGKLETWSDEMVDSDEVIKRVKKFSSSTGMMVIHSGMGQGNFQHGSGFLHCLADDYADYITEQIMSLQGVTIRSVSLISSDDSTKMVMMIFNRTEKMLGNISKIILSFADIFTGLRKLANIHINWKKTAIQMIITEFNSVFTILKRSYLASVKDCYNSVNIVDFTRPEEAVKEALSSIARLRDCGCYLNTINEALLCNREFFITSYNYSEEDISYLTEVLECSDQELPFNLGFVPLIMPFEVLTYGPEVMIAAAKSKPLKLFYENVYSLSTLSIPSSLEEDPETICKATIELDYMKDSQLKTLKKKVFSLWDEIDEKHMTHLLLNDYSSTISTRDFKMYLKDYIMRVKKTYAFSSTYRYNSVIRAMQLNYSCRLVSDDMEDESTDIRSMVIRILDEKPILSFVGVFDIYKPIVDEYSLTIKSMTKLRKKKISRHPKFRELTFFNRTFGEKVSDKEMIKAIFSTDRDIKSSMSKAVEDFSKMINVNADELMENPFKVSKERFEMKPLLTMLNYIRWYCKFYSVKNVKMVSDFSTTWDRESDMALLYYYKTNPEFVYLDEDLDDIEEERKLMENELSFGKIKDAVSLSLTKTRSRRRDQVLEMISGSTVVREEGNTAELRVKNWKFLESRPVYALKKGPNESVDHCYLDHSGKIVLTEKASNQWEIKVYGLISDAIRTMVYRELTKVNRTTSNMKIAYNISASEKYIETVDKFLGSGLMNTSYVLRFQKPKLIISRTVGMWKAELMSGREIMTIFKGEKVFYHSVSEGLMTEDMAIFHNFVVGETNYKEVHDFILRIYDAENPFFITKGGISSQSKDIQEDLGEAFVSSLLDMSNLGYIDDEEFDGSNSTNSFEEAEALEEGQAEDEWFQDRILSPEFIDEITQMRFERTLEYEENFSAVNSILMFTLTKCIQTEIVYNIRRFFHRVKDSKSLITLIANVLVRDLFFEEEGDLSEFVATLTAMSMIKLTSFNQRFVQNLEIKRLSAKALKTIMRTFEWSNNEDLNEALEELEE